MKTTITKTLLMAAAVISMLSACRKDDENTTPTKADIYVVNYGYYGSTPGEISSYDYATNTISNNQYLASNGINFTSNIQSIVCNNGKMYCMSNNSDKIDILDAKTLKVVANPIVDTVNIKKPRYMVTNGNLGYISCFGTPGDAYWTTMPNSSIAIIDLTTNKYLRSVKVPNATEGMIVSEGKLFIALEYINKIAVMDLSTEAVSYIDVPALGQQFVQDNSGKLWASMVSEYTVSFDSTKVGVVCINPKNNTVETFINIKNISSDGPLAINAAKDKIFVLVRKAASETAVYTVSASNKTVSAAPLVSGKGFNSIGYDVTKSRLYVTSGSTSGLLTVYDENGTKEHEVQVGVYPQQIYFNYSY